MQFRILLPMVQAAVQLALAAQVVAQPTSADHRIVVIIDGSGSMYQDLEGNQSNPQTPLKIVEAQKYASGFFSALPEEALDAEIALMAYGGSCQSVHRLVPFGNSRDITHLKEMSSALKRIKPDGQTPLTTALEQAANFLGYRDHPSTIILVSDGEESCRRDPCEIAERLERQAIDFQVQVIGFAVLEEEFDTLRCIAERTGGQIYNAKSGLDLQEMLVKALRNAIHERMPGGEGEGIVARKPRLAAGPGRVTVEARARGIKGTIEIAPSSQAYGYVFPDAVAASAVKVVRELPQSFQLDPGKYIVRLKLDGDRGEKSFVVGPGADTQAVVYLDPAVLNLIAWNKQTGDALPGHRVAWSIKAGKQVYRTLEHENPAELRVSRGLYEVTLKVGGKPADSKRVLANLGQTQELRFFALDESRGNVSLQLDAVQSDYFTPDGSLAPVARLIRQSGGKTSEILKKGGRSFLIEQNLPPGDYVLEVDYGGDVSKEAFTLPPGVDLVGEIKLSPGALYAKTVNSSGPVNFEVYHLDGDQSVKLRSDTGVLNATLPPGRYRIVAIEGAQTATGKIEIKRNKVSSLVLEP